MATTPTQRSLKYFRDLGYTCGITEHWNSHVGIRQDLFGIIDILCVGNGETIGVQCTSKNGFSARVKKVRESDVLLELKASGWRIIIQGWYKAGNRWRRREVEL